MKKIQYIKKALLIAVVLMCFTMPAWSQTGFEEDVEDIPEEEEAPIDSVILFGFAAGALLAYKVLGKQEKTV